MIVPIIILALAAGIFLFLYRAISMNKTAELNSLATQKQTLKGKYQFMVNHRKELKQELEKKEKQLITLQNNQEGIKTVSIADLAAEDVDENEKVSRYLIQEGKITMEQNEKVLQKMEILQMDYIGVCMTLGYIDIKTAKNAIKINKIHSKSEGFN